MELAVDFAKNLICIPPCRFSGMNALSKYSTLELKFLYFGLVLNFWA